MREAVRRLGTVHTPASRGGRRRRRRRGNPAERDALLIDFEWGDVCVREREWGPAFERRGLIVRSPRQAAGGPVPRRRRRGIRGRGKGRGSLWRRGPGARADATRGAKRGTREPSPRGGGRFLDNFRGVRLSWPGTGGCVQPDPSTRRGSWETIYSDNKKSVPSVPQKALT